MCTIRVGAALAPRQGRPISCHSASRFQLCVDSMVSQPAGDTVTLCATGDCHTETGDKMIQSYHSHSSIIEVILIPGVDSY